MPVANFVESVVVYDDVENASNPQRKHVDWKRSATGLAFDEVNSERFTLAPGAQRNILNSPYYRDSLGAPVTFAPVSAQPTWYQVRGTQTWMTSIATPAEALVLTAQVDGSLYAEGVAISSLPAVGDWVYLAGSAYGDAGVVSVDNQGFWVVTAVSTGIYMKRVYPTDPMGVTETVTTSALADIQTTSDAARPRWVFMMGCGIFSGLKQVLGAGAGWLSFALESRFVPTPVAVVPIHVVSTASYAAYARVESDKPVTLYVGDVDYDNRNNEASLLPVKDGAPAWHESFGFIMYMQIVNTGSEMATINVIHAIAKTES